MSVKKLSIGDIGHEGHLQIQGIHDSVLTLVEWENESLTIRFTSIALRFPKELNPHLWVYGALIPNIISRVSILDVPACLAYMELEASTMFRRYLCDSQLFDWVVLFEPSLGDWIIVHGIDSLLGKMEILIQSPVDTSPSHWAN